MLYLSQHHIKSIQLLRYKKMDFPKRHDYALLFQLNWIFSSLYSNALQLFTAQLS